ncbi:MAG: DUF1573 domain-containing protein [Bacteroidetes bacterium]|nr:MAG: DUF1573 domain-containing protein [Bacteroidota bacterium]
MKRLPAVVVAFLLLCNMGFAQQNQSEKATPKQDETVTGPVMTFENTEIDYGEIEQNSDPYRYFRFTNTGTEPLIIKNAKGSCGCTVPTWPKEPILPGEAGEIKVRYDTKRIGPFTKTVTIYTNEAVERHVLKIKGKVNPKPPEPEGVPASKSGFGND